ncbi:MAG: 50S ribosomal protein L21 [Cytophagales bacterium]|nr:50S ribosomal protein L21 [Cytophagales bacterium]
MYAIVEIAGKQYKVQKDIKLYTNRLPLETGKDVTFDKVLLVANDDKIKVGVPTVAGAKIKAKVLAHVRTDKVVVFKKKRRKDYRKFNTHRSDMTQIQIESIVA